MHLLEHFKELTLRPKNAQELKGLVLQLAIQGKLTSKWRLENPNPEPVSSLLIEVQKEREKLIKEKKIKKESTNEKSKINELPFNIPNNWKWCKLIELSSINGGFAFKSTNYLEEGIRVIRISDFDENGFKNHKIVRHIYSDELNPYVLEDKNILIAMTGGTVGKSLFVNQVPEVMIVNQRVATVKVFKPIYEAYINCVIPTKLIQDVIEEAKNSTNDNISMSDIKGFNIPLPPLEEQKAIVTVVETLFKEVEQLEQLTAERISLKEKFVISALSQLTTNNSQKEWSFLQEHFYAFFNEKNNIKKLRETILQLAVQGKLTADWRANNPDVEDGIVLLKRIQKEKAKLIKDKKIKKETALPDIDKGKIPYELPDGWVWCRLGDIIKEKPRNGYSPRGVEFETQTKSLKLGATTKGIFDSSQVKYLDEVIPDDSHLWLQNNDILIQRSNSLDYVGVSAIYKGEKFAFVYPDLMMKIQSSKFIDTNYLHTVLSSAYIRQYFRDNASGTSSNMPKINQSIVLNTMIPLCYELEQKAIVEKINALMDLCDALEKEIKQSQEQSEKLMRSVLREVFETNNAL